MEDPGRRTRFPQIAGQAGVCDWRWRHVGEPDLIQLEDGVGGSSKPVMVIGEGHTRVESSLRGCQQVILVPADQAATTVVTRISHTTPPLLRLQFPISTLAQASSVSRQRLHAPDAVKYAVDESAREGGGLH